MAKIDETKTLHLSKKLIINLPIFMESAVKTLASFTNLETKKLSHEIKKFDANLDGKHIIAIMQFSGDFDGSFILIFSNDIAILTLESLLGEKINPNDFNVLKDGVGEFCNIIMGSIKTALSKEDINIIFELPKTYISLRTVQDVILEENGVWVNMLLSKMPFYMFIGKATV